jgi:hypothetical protein
MLIVDSSQTTPNAELAYRVLDHIDANPSKHDQRHWCGTAQCFAGWAVELAGERPISREEPYVLVDGQEIHVGHRAAQLLGFRSEEALNQAAFNEIGEVDEYELFSSNNTREDLGSIVEAAFGPRPVRPASES